MNLLWLTVCTALAKPMAAAPVVEAVEAGQIDWSAMKLQVTSRSDRTVGAWKDRRVQEQDALNRLGPLLTEAALRIRVRPEVRADDLTRPSVPETDVLARTLRERLADWLVRETRYLSGGGVEMDGVLDLQNWLRPALLTVAAGQPQAPNPNGPTGVLIDARPLAFRPCVAPTIALDDDTVIYDASRITPDTVRVHSPVVYVTDPVAPAANKRSGSQPLFISAESSAHDCVLRLSRADSARLRQNKALPGLLATAKVVIVVAP